MTNEEILKKLSEVLDGQQFQVEEHHEMLTVTVNASRIHPVITVLKERLGFNFLTDLCGIHYPEREKALGVIYHLHHLQENIRVRLKTFVTPDNPHISTITDLYAGANWMERETYDFYGIVFDGHPNMKKILNVDYLDYFPMRKEYPLEDPTREDKADHFFGR